MDALAEDKVLLKITIISDNSSLRQVNGYL
jgi:hypothetical protein